MIEAPFDHAESAKAESVSTRALVSRLWQHCRLRKGAVALILAACALETGFYWIVPLAFRSLIDNTLGRRDEHALVQLTAVLIGGAAIACIGSIQRGRVYAHLQSQIISDLRFQLFHKIHQLPVSFFTTTPSAQVVARTSSDLAAIENSLALALSWGLMPGLDSIIGTIVLFVLDWRLGLVAAIVWPWCLLVPARLAPTAASASYQRRLREADMLDAVQQTIAGHGMIRAYNLEEHATRDFFIRDADLFVSATRVNFLMALMDQAAAVGILLLQVITISIGVWMAFHGRMTIGTLAAFQGLFLSVTNSLVYFTDFSRHLLPARAALRRIDEFLALPERVGDAPEARPAPPFTTAIELKQVSLIREGRILLDDVSLRIARGSFVAIVGGNGAGKSTLLGLLLRFDDPTSGTIVIDGHDLRSLQQRSWRSQLGIVFQENVLFNGSVRENIRLGRPAASDQAVEDGAVAAEIHDTIGRLPQGYDSSVGHHGRRFSGGERQRIALARALIRNPAILLLDEATSSLDPETDAAINETLRRVGRKRTIISVTHRLSSIISADEIFVMRRGRLAERGTHDSLLAAGGVYAQMWHKQHAAAVDADADRQELRT